MIDLGQDPEDDIQVEGHEAMILTEGTEETLHPLQTEGQRVKINASSKWKKYIALCMLTGKIKNQLTQWDLRILPKTNMLLQMLQSLKEQ